jgi:hypothetical protein
MRGSWGRAALVLLLVAAGATPRRAGGQEVAAESTLLRTAGGEFPGGAGAGLRIGSPPWSVFRLRLSLGRAWGRDTGPATTCDLYWPVSEGSFTESATRKNTMTQLDAVVVAMTPSLKGVSVGVGIGVGAYSFDVSRRGEVTGRVERPVAGGREWMRVLPTWLARLEYAPPFARGFVVSVDTRPVHVDFQGCVLDAWALCGRKRFDRVAVGLGYRVR